MEIKIISCGECGSGISDADWLAFFGPNQHVTIGNFTYYCGCEDGEKSLGGVLTEVGTPQPRRFRLRSTPNMKHAFLAHPLGGDVKANLARAMRWYKWACDHYYPSHSFEATWMLNCLVYDDADAEQRSRGLARSFNMLEDCDELWLVGGLISPGMDDEITYACNYGAVVYDLTNLGPEPPAHPYRGEMTRLLGTSMV